MFREEYPRPQLVRQDWKNLNGKWDFAIHSTDDPCYFNDAKNFNQKIEVPFCPESTLSGIGHKDFLYSIWYRKTIRITKAQLTGRVLLHFGAVDYQTAVYVNGQEAGTHTGGYASFSFDITSCLQTGENALLLHARDDTVSPQIPSGKQSPKTESHGCMYTRTTGVWQTVWLEFVPNLYLTSLKLTPDVEQRLLYLKGRMNRNDRCTLKAIVRFRGQTVKTFTCPVEGGHFHLKASIPEPLHLWDIFQPNLYDIHLALCTPEGEDAVDSYFGFREIEFRGKALYLNDKPVFLKQVLDQGFYPDGIYTAPTDHALEQDIDLSIALGFNGARLHEKVFEERFLYHADKKGYLVWGEYPNWGIPFTTKNPVGARNFMREWKEILERDYNHPSIIGWCPLNEAWRHSGQACDYISQKRLYDLTKAFDPTRPCIGSSGGDLHTGDVEDVHSYCHQAKKFAKIIIKHDNAHPAFLRFIENLAGARLLTKKQLQNLPLYVSEYGGMAYQADGENAWGYNTPCQSEKALLDKYEALTRAVCDSGAFGFCYTQLYDVEQEQNGLLKYDRTHKLSSNGLERIRNINQAGDFTPLAKNGPK